jgi:MoxR-like ATPase
MYEQTVRIREEVKKVIIGKDDVISKVLMAILAQGHVLLEDVPGVGKTTLAMAFARTLGLDTRRVQFTSDTMPSDIIGFSVYDMKSGELQYKPGAIMTNLLLADEINRTSSKTQSALLEAMEERQVTVDGITHPLQEPFIVLATQNPVGSAGTQMLPSAQMDRFLMRLSIGYPDHAGQIEIMKERHHANPLDTCSAVTDIPELKKLIEEVTQVHVADDIYSYIADLAEATRKNSYIQLGVSPRGALAVCRTAKAAAYMAGRDYVTPEDVGNVLPDVCAHRLVLFAKAKLHEYTAGQILQEILESVTKPDVKEIDL